MRPCALLLALLGTLFLLPLQAAPSRPADAAAEADIPTRYLDPGDNLLKTLVLPAWGSYESESYLLSTVQGFVDLMALGALVALAADPPNPDAGVHLIPVFLGGMIVGNRLLALPFNAAMVARYNQASGPRRVMRLPSHRLHGRLGAALGGYDNSAALSVGGEWRRIGLRMTAALTPGGSEEVSWSDSLAQAYRSEHYEISSHFSLDVSYRLGLNAFLDLEPGVDFRLASYRYGGYSMPWDGFASVETQPRRFPFSPLAIPHAALVAHAHRRVEAVVGVGYLLNVPDHVEEFRRRAKALGASGGADSPWRLNAELAVWIR